MFLGKVRKPQANTFPKVNVIKELQGYCFFRAGYCDPNTWDVVRLSSQ